MRICGRASGNGSVIISGRKRAMIGWSWDYFFSFRGWFKFDHSICSQWYVLSWLFATLAPTPINPIVASSPLFLHALHSTPLVTVKHHCLSPLTSHEPIKTHSISPPSDLLISPFFPFLIPYIALTNNHTHITTSNYSIPITRPISKSIPTPRHAPPHSLKTKKHNKPHKSKQPLVTVLKKVNQPLVLLTSMLVKTIPLSYVINMPHTAHSFGPFLFLTNWFIRIAWGLFYHFISSSFWWHVNWYLAQYQFLFVSFGSWYKTVCSTSPMVPPFFPFVSFTSVWLPLPSCQILTIPPFNQLY